MRRNAVLGVPPDPDGDRAVDRFRQEAQTGLQGVVLTLERRVVRCPQLTHEAEVLVGHRAAALYGTSRASNSSSITPTPAPMMMRPSVSTSSEAKNLAVTTGFR